MSTKKLILRMFFSLISVSILVISMIWYFGESPFDFKSKGIEFFADMDYSAQPELSDASVSISNEFPVIPAENLIPKYKEKYLLNQLEFEKAENLHNPYSFSGKDMARAKLLFEAFCVDCHGSKGLGDGKVITDVELAEEEEGFPAPLSFASKESREKSDGRLFHIISAGQNLMFPQSHKLSRRDRWLLTEYVRKLQAGK